jgi:hypothetical protein
MTQPLPDFQDCRPRAMRAEDADRLVVAVLARDNVELRREYGLRSLAGWLGLLPTDIFTRAVEIVMRQRRAHEMGAPIGPVLWARYGSGQGERALQALLMQRDTVTRLREVNSLAVVAQSRGVPVCLVGLMRFALWEDDGVPRTGEAARRDDINQQWMAEYLGAKANHID